MGLQWQHPHEAGLELSFTLFKASRPSYVIHNKNSDVSFVMCDSEKEGRSINLLPNNTSNIREKSILLSYKIMIISACPIYAYHQHLTH